MVEKQRRQEILPVSLPPRGLSRVIAAAYLGISPPTFDEMVRDGRMPSPKIINRRIVWDRMALDRAFEALPQRDQGNDPDADGWADYQ
jgi:excisionase family DNA binding protein